MAKSNVKPSNAVKIEEVIGKLENIQMGLKQNLADLQLRLGKIDPKPELLSSLESLKKDAEKKAQNLESEVKRLREEIESIKEEAEYHTVIADLTGSERILVLDEEPPPANPENKKKENLGVFSKPKNKQY